MNRRQFLLAVIAAPVAASLAAAVSLPPRESLVERILASLDHRALLGQTSGLIWLSREGIRRVSSELGGYDGYFTTHLAGVRVVVRPELLGDEYWVTP